MNAFEGGYRQGVVFSALHLAGNLGFGILAFSQLWICFSNMLSCCLIWVSRVGDAADLAFEKKLGRRGYETGEQMAKSGSLLFSLVPGHPPILRIQEGDHVRKRESCKGKG